MSKTGFLITNLGTPASAEVKDVRAYLKQFLMDPYVLDVPKPIRSLIVNAFILPFRPKNSAEAYASIWQADGSPLLTISESLQQKLAQRLDAPVALGMRYGKPAIEDAISDLRHQGVDQIIVIPLYPQYADSTVTTTIEQVNTVLPEDMSASFITSFYNDPGYVSALVAGIKAALPEQFDHVLLSYHGLPERHMKKADPTGSHCMSSPDCCEQASKAHATCYRHQAFATSQSIANGLNLTEDQYTVCFQSRLGGGWLKPYTDQVLEELPNKGIKHLVVICPAFVADNLETLEEMGIRGKESFIEAGGETFTLVPCLNTDDAWVEALAQMLANENQTDSASAETSA